LGRKVGRIGEAVVRIGRYIRGGVLCRRFGLGEREIVLRLLGLEGAGGLDSFEFALGAGIGSLHTALGAPKTVEKGNLDFGARDFVVDIDLADLHASQFPLRNGHLLEVKEFGSGTGLPFAFENVAEALKFLAVFTREDDDAGTQAMTEGIQPDSCFSLGCSGAGGALCVPTIGLDLLLCCHKFWDERSQFTARRVASGARLNGLFACSDCDEQSQLT